MIHGTAMLSGDVIPIKALPAAMSRYVEAIGAAAQAELAVQGAMESISGSPVDTGRFRASFDLNVGPEPTFRGLGSGQAFPVRTMAHFDAIVAGVDGKASIWLTDDASTGRGSYAFVIDRGRMPNVTLPRMGGSHQARLGVTGPAFLRAFARVRAARVEERAARL